MDQPDPQWYFTAVSSRGAGREAQFRFLRRWGLLAAASMAVLMSVGAASASWPMPRHDPKRTGASGGTSDITSPAVYWKTYLGGRLDTRSMITADIDGDGQMEVVYLAGGRATAKHANDDLVWQTLPLDLVQIIGIDDLDGDGNSDIIVASGDHVYVLSGPTGLVEWAEPDGEMGTIDAVRLADLDGDAKPELVVEECVCCAVSSGTPGVVYSFGKGFASARLLWKLPTAGCAGGRSLTIADLDGSGSHQVVLSDNSSFLALNGPDGAVLANSGSLGTWLATSTCRAVNIDGGPGDEVLCILSSSSPPATNQRRAFLLHFDAAQSSLSLSWSHTLAPDAGGDVSFVNPILDLDGDGRLEVVLAGKDASNSWTTYVLDAVTGSEIARIDGERLVGTAPLLAGGHSALLTTLGSDLMAYSFAATPQPAIKPAWKLSGRTVFTEPDWSLVRTCSSSDRIVSLDLNQDGSQDLVTRLQGQSAVEVDAGLTGVALGSVTFTPGIDAENLWVLPALAGNQKQLAISRTDGFLTLYDGGLMPLNARSADRPGIRIGGYYPSGGWRDLQRQPIAAAVDGQKSDRIIVSDSRGTLLRLDAQVASLVAPPIKVWEQAHTFGAIAVAGLNNASMGIAALGNQEPLTSPPGFAIKALDANGKLLWTRSTDAVPLNDLVPGTFDADGVPDLAFQWGDPGDVLLRTRAISGKTGATLWDSTPFDPGAGRQPAGISVGEWNGDAADDVIFQGNGTRVLSGVNGAELMSGGPTDAYFLATLFDVDGDHIDEVTLHGGYSSARTISHDLSTVIWAGTEDDRPYPYGAVAGCPGGPVLAEGSLAHPARLKMTRLAGPTVGIATTEVLAGGRVFSDEATARGTGARLGQLTSVVVHANLTGKGHPSALLGSTEGWLYSINPCNGQLDFSYPFEAAVGSPIFGDTDGDGRDEILVPVADGYLYGIKNEALKPPPFVWDIDVAHGVVDKDIADIATKDTLSGRWGEVAGATSYEVAVVDSTDSLISVPAWKSVGLVTQGSLPGLPLKDGEKYRFAVRAVGALGSSIDTISDGVTVHLETEMDAGADAAADAAPSIEASTPDDSGAEPSFVDASASDAFHEAGNEAGNGDFTAGGGCGCRTANGPDFGGPMAAAVAALGILIRRRRSRRDSCAF